MPAAVYCRVSTIDQKADSQMQELRRWLTGNGFAPDDPESVTWFVDSETGENLNRPAFERLQRAVFDGTVRTVVVWRFDRLSRSLKDGVALVCDWCGERGVRLVSVCQQLDLTGAVGRMVAAVLFGIAECELESIRARQRAGIAAAKRRGVYRGRQPGTTAASPARAAELAAQGLTVAEIANALGTSHRTIQRYLRQIGATPLETTVTER